MATQREKMAIRAMKKLIQLGRKAYKEHDLEKGTDFYDAASGIARQEGLDLFYETQEESKDEPTNNNNRS